MTNFFQIISAKITTFITVVIVTITSILPWSGSNRIKSVDTPTASPTVVVLESTPSASVTPTPTPKAKIRVQITLTPTPVVTEAQTKEVQKPKVDSAVGIEQCRTSAKEKRKEEEKKVNDEYAKSEPKIVELAASQNNGQTEATALKYGLITQKDVVRSADVFLELVNQGYPQETAQSMATSMYGTYSTYLRSLHDWAVSELSKWNTVLKDKFDTYESQVYQRCLSVL
ncbi:hypothetical protein D4R99_05610 [bacterium]|nr:MAG: hypothetical protein D4R99_05610 [bacterium]